MRALCRTFLVVCLLLGCAYPALAGSGPNASEAPSGSWAARILDVGFANIPLLNWLFGEAEPAAESRGGLEPWGAQTTSGTTETGGAIEPWGVDDPSASDTELTTSETEDPSSSTTEREGGLEPWG